MTTKKNIDPERPVSRPQAPPVVDTTWGKTLTREELTALLTRLDTRKKEREMTKLSDTLARALAKKQGRTHVDGSDAGTTVEKKSPSQTPSWAGSKAAY